MAETHPDFAKQRKIAAIACIAALVLLVMHSRCTSSHSSETKSPMTQKSDAVGKSDTAGAEPDAGLSILQNNSPATSDLSIVDPDAGLPKSQNDELLSTAGAKTVERVLLLGFDRSGGDLGRTDGIVIAVFDYAAGHVGLISVPRDLWVDIPGLDQGRINIIYRVGTRTLGREKGLALLKSVIRRNLGIPIDYTIAADFEGFVSAVDELGGITVDVKCPIEDCFWLGEGDACVPLSLTAGEHHLDGRTALLFARSRHGRTDLDRGRRQQAVLMGLKNRLIRPASLLRLPQISSKLGKFVETDLTLDAMIRMGSLVQQAGNHNIHGLVLKPPIVEGRSTEDKKSILVLNPKEWRRALAALFVASPPGTRDRGMCPAADVGLNWRDRKQKAEEKHHTSTASPADN